MADLTGRAAHDHRVMAYEKSPAPPVASYKTLGNTTS
jgi:hypothetical protein